MRYRQGQQLWLLDFPDREFSYRALPAPAGSLTAAALESGMNSIAAGSA